MSAETVNDMRKPEQMAVAALAQQWAEGFYTLQREVLSATEQASRTLTDRAQSETALWFDFMAKLSAARSAPEFLEAYSSCISHRMQAAVDDSRRLIENYHGAMSKMVDAMNNGAAHSTRTS